MGRTEPSGGISNERTANGRLAQPTGPIDKTMSRSVNHCDAGAFRTLPAAN